MKMAKTRRAVRNISIKRPRAIEVLSPRVVETFMGPGNRADTTPAEAIDPSICEMKTRSPLNQPTAPMRHMPRVTLRQVSLISSRTGRHVHTAGLKRPPVMRKKTHAFTASEKPKARLMYSKAEVLGACVKDPLVPPVLEVEALATWVAAKAKKRNKKVPVNSPIMAIM